MRHVDNTCSGGQGRLCNGRRLSAVYYLNPRWAAADGAELCSKQGRTGLRLAAAPEGGGLQRQITARSQPDHQITPSRITPEDNVLGWCLRPRTLHYSRCDHTYTQYLVTPPTRRRAADPAAARGEGEGGGGGGASRGTGDRHLA